MDGWEKYFYMFLILFVKSIVYNLLFFIKIIIFNYFSFYSVFFVNVFFLKCVSLVFF